MNNYGSIINYYYHQGFYVSLYCPITNPYVYLKDQYNYKDHLYVLNQYSYLNKRDCLILIKRAEHIFRKNQSYYCPFIYAQKQDKYNSIFIFL